MAKPFNRSRDRQPQRLSDLIRILIAAIFNKGHLPEQDDLGHAIVRVADGAQIVSYLAGAAGFFLYLAHSGFLERFTVFDFAARKGPILMAFAVNHHHFVASGSTALQNPAGGFDDRWVDWGHGSNGCRHSLKRILISDCNPY